MARAREPNFESLEDTYKDLINYASFAVSYIRGKMEGQDGFARDMFNRPLSKEQIEAKVDELLKEPILSEDTSGGSSCGLAIPTEEIEDDGFITVVPSLFTYRGAAERQNISLNPDKNTTTEEKIKAAYFGHVAGKGEVHIPRGVVNCTDSLQHSYVKEVVQDIGDRLEGDYDELAKKQSER
jgi:hypothetical protein